MSELTNINLLILFKLFKDRPNHLARFLLENDAFNKVFLDKLNKNGKLSEIKNIDDIKKDFDDIEDMKEFYNSLINTPAIRRRVQKDIISEITNKIEKALEKENYEEAARLRDYLKNVIKKNTNI